MSGTVVENDFVGRVYEKLSGVYDLTFGPLLHPGRLYAKDRLGIKPGDRVLEVGVGTGINMALYPRDCHLTGIDFSASMLDKARERVSRQGIDNVRLMEMDAAAMTFADDAFDVVYAPYLISVVPDPVQVVREMRRVCRPGGRIIILNHFLSTNPVLVDGREGDLAADGAHRVQVRSRPAAVPLAGGTAAAVDPEGDAADLVARHLRQGIARLRHSNTQAPPRYYSVFWPRFAGRRPPSALVRSCRVTPILTSSRTARESA